MAGKLSYERQALAWAIILLLVIAFVAVFRGILLPFVAGLGIAYFLNPVADRLERIGLSRGLSTLVIVLLMGFLGGLVLVFLFPLIAGQLRDLALSLPDQLQALRRFLEDIGRQWLGENFATIQKALESEFAELSKSWTAGLGQVLQSLWSGGLALVNFLAFLIVTPVVAFYLLLDWERMIARVDSWLPRDHAPTIRRLAHEIDEVLAGFIRGQGTVAFILGLIYAIGLTWAGLKYGLLIGLMTGLLSFVPFVGSVTGFITAMGFGLAQFWPDYVPLLKIVAVFAVAQGLEGYVLSPNIVGQRIRLHPVWLIFSLFAFSYLFGLVGLLIAVPVAAAIGVLARFTISEYRQSALYRGSAGALPAGAGEGQPERQDGQGRQGGQDEQIEKAGE